MMTKKCIFFATIIATIAGCATSPTPEEEQQQANVADVPENQPEYPSSVIGTGNGSTSASTSGPAKLDSYTHYQQMRELEPGMITVHRQGANYDIKYKIDVGHESVNFQMGVPDEGYTVINGATFPDRSDPELERQEQLYESSKYVFNAQSYFYDRKYYRALHETDKAIELTPGLAIAHALKGSIHFKLGEKSQAINNWEKALELDPSMDEVRLSLERIR